MSESRPGSEPGTGGRFTRGALYLGVANWIVQGVTLLTGLAVARILGPETFGIYALAIAINEFINLVNCLGVAPALVQSRNESQDLYDTGYALSIGQSVLGILVAAGVALFVSSESGALVGWFLLLLGLVRLGVLLADVVTVKLDRNLRYAAGAVLLVTTRIVPNLLCVWLAWVGVGAWSLILRDLMVGLLPVVVAHWMSGYRFRWRVTRDAAREILSFAVPMLAARSLDVFVLRLDRLIVGSVLGTRTIGLYHQARFIADAGLLATTPIMRVTFNLYSRLQDEPQRLARSFGLVNFAMARVFGAGAIILIAYPDETIRLLLGDEWRAAAEPLRVLGVYAALLPIIQNMQIVLYTRAQAFMNVRMRLAQLVVFVPSVLWAASRGDVVAIAASLLAAHVAGVLVGWLALRDLMHRRVLAQFGAPAVALIAAAGLLAWVDVAALGAPWWSLPFLAPLVFVAIDVAIDRGTVFREVRYLRELLGRSS